MPRILRVPLAALSEGEHEFDAAAAHYVRNVHRLRAGARFTVFDPEARLEGDALLLDERARQGSTCTCRVSNVRGAVPGSILAVTLLQGASKGDRLERVIRDATALGVRAMHVVQCERSVTRWNEDDPKRRQRFSAIMVDAARQSGRGDLPELSGPSSLSNALSRVGPGRRVVLDPEATTSLRAALEGWQPADPLALLIGPEGGLTRDELSSSASVGFVAARFGTHVLRTETAATAALGALLLHEAERLE